ncbi:hypothetical protein [Deinococcus sedimenti]|uniref:Uncharacterized protein n=1 Tax=Deinococcus sedimenti TaxID=1867090 RepID=A0ABQ2S3X5_9DEIO|nr:hypothetical protein [Deinococcus sedimenti]GGR95306.1 hypothetical protein GCM10008960_22790 [Deinococcus sedimenti]
MRQENAPRPALRRPLLGLLTLSLLAAPAALAQTANPVMPPAPAPVTTEPTPAAPAPAPTTPPEPAPAETTPTDAAPADAAPTDATPATVAPTETAPADAPTGDVPPSSLPAAGSVTVPKLDGEEVLKTVPTVLGEALIYRGDAEDALARTAQALVAEGYQAAGAGGAAPTADAAGVTTLTLTKDDQQFQLTQRSSMGLTVVALARLPESENTPAAPAAETPAPDRAPATDPAPADTAPSEAPAEAAPAEPAPADAAPTEPAPTEPAPGEPAPTEPVTPAPVTPPSQP